MTDDERQDEQAEETYEDLESDEGPTSTAAGVSNGGPG